MKMTTSHTADPARRAEQFLAGLPDLARCDRQTVRHQLAGARKLLTELCHPPLTLRAVEPSPKAADPTELIAKLGEAVRRLEAAAG